MTEAAICLPLLALLLQGGLYFGNACFLHENTIVSARYMAWRRLRTADSLVREADYNCIFKQNYPLMPGTDVEVESSSLSVTSDGAIAAADKALLSATDRPLMLGPAIIGTVIAKSSGNSRVTVKVPYPSPYSLLGRPIVLAASQLLPGATFTKDDLYGPEIITAEKFELAKYESDNFKY